MPCVCQMHCKKARVKHCRIHSPPQVVEVGKKKTFVILFPGQLTVQSYVLYDILNSLQNINSVWSNSKLLITLHCADIKCYRRSETQIQKTCMKCILCIFQLLLQPRLLNVDFANILKRVLHKFLLIATIILANESVVHFS